MCDGTDGTPDLRNIFLQGWGEKSVHSFIEAGLPNITGTFSGTHVDPTGAFKTENDPYYLAYASDSRINYLNFDASRCSPIYGRSNTVQPPAYVVYYIMKMA